MVCKKMSFKFSGLGSDNKLLFVETVTWIMIYDTGTAVVVEDKVQWLHKERGFQLSRITESML